MARGNPYTGWTRKQLVERAEDMGLSVIRGETEEQLAERMAAYENTLARGRRVSLFGLQDSRKRS